LGEAGYVDGRNVAIEYRFAESQYDRLPMLAADVVGSKVAVIAVTGGGASILAAMAATKTISIVFTTGGDPVQDSYVASLNRPGSNVTGVSWSERDIALAASWGSRGEGADRVRCSRPYPLDKNGMLRQTRRTAGGHQGRKS